MSPISEEGYSTLLFPVDPEVLDESKSAISYSLQLSAFYGSSAYER